MTDVRSVRSLVLLEMTVAGKPQHEVADAAGVSIRTVRRWQKHPDNIAAVAAARHGLERVAIARLAELRQHVFEVLANHLVHGDEQVQIRAAKLVLEQGLAHRAAVQGEHYAAVEASLARLERDDSRRLSGYRR